MSCALTVKSQVTQPKAKGQHLAVRPGDAVDYEALPDGRVAIVAAIGTRKPLVIALRAGLGRASPQQARCRSCAQPAVKAHCDDPG